MLTIEKTDVWGWEHAIRGMRNPMNSWDRSDSDPKSGTVGDADLTLMRSLYKAGPSHRKYLRQIFVSTDITAPLYWWKEFDTYKVGTVANSCSTMHKIHSKAFELDDFSHEHLSQWSMMMLKNTIYALNRNRVDFAATKEKEYWWQIIQLLPSSYNQKRTVTMSYENVMSIIDQRTGHKLDEWKTLIDSFRQLPYVTSIRGETNDPAGTGDA